ncbi:bifunctional EF-hand domain/EF-Hand 1 [Babesia duncani]|uniref:Bifunctional EF-hand domain/EF-Hand 1 n=1 Tax=Babesia duncani TaxID=323732 RepID=A0AAD9UPP5_9APIC|nr:bifunctional EF-hand domain/EF-Hand 1 [Babesia duncani]
MGVRKGETSFSLPGKINIGSIPRKGKYEIREDQLKEITEAFNIIDTERTGKMDYHELKIVLRALGFEAKKQHVLELINQHDDDKDGQITFEKYKEIMAKKFSERGPLEEINRAFDLFDEEGKGKITFGDLKRVSLELVCINFNLLNIQGHELSDEELGAMIDEFDKDNDGAITREDFQGIMQQTNLYM